MIEFNWRGIGFCLLVILICMGGIWAVTGKVSAAENESYVIVTNPESIYEPTSLNSSTIENATAAPLSIVNGQILPTVRVHAYNNTRIEQGQCIEVGGVYDVSSVIGFTFTTENNIFSYNGRYEDAFEPTNDTVEYLHKMPYNRESYYKFYVDPAIFGERLGYWYQYTNTYEKAANKRAFYVSDQCIVDANKTHLLDVNNTPVLLNPRYLEPRHVSDILLASDDPLLMKGITNGTKQIWVFGATTSVLGREIDASTLYPLFDTADTKKWPSGSYKILLQTGGEDKRYDVVYEQNLRNPVAKDFLVPALRSIDIVDVTGYQPVMIKDALVNLLDMKNGTDDEYKIYSMEVQNPIVDITGYQEIQFNNQSLLEVAGYTNKMPGTPVTLYVDRNEQTGKSDKYPGMTLMVEEGALGDFRTFHGYIPLYYENIAPGFHNITAVLPSGTKSSVDFYIRQEPKPHYQEPKWYKFIDGNPFVPEPTPIIIEKEVIKEVVRTEIETVIVKEPVDYITLAKTTMVMLVAPVIIIGTPLIYLLTVIARAFAERRTRKPNEKKND